MSDPLAQWVALGLVIMLLGLAAVVMSDIIAPWIDRTLEKKMKTYYVYVGEALVDTVQFSGYTTEEVKRSLVTHDGYSEDIIVKEAM